MGNILSALQGQGQGRQGQGQGQGQGVTDYSTLSTGRQPLYDGASGLHYSGRVYANQFQQLGANGNVCANTGSVSPDQIRDIFPNGVSSTTLPVDATTNRISQTALQSYVSGLVQSGKIPGERSDGNLDSQMKDDNTFYTKVNAEYCFYEVRYRVALDQFLTLAASQTPDQAAVTAALSATTVLNTRLNSLLEILNFVSNDRAQKVSARNPKLDAANAALQEKISILKSQQTFLQSSDVRTKTQEEMMRYSAEKSQAMNIQIAFFVALNVVALGTILTVYRGVRSV